MADSRKESLLDSAISLLQECERPEEITTRRIAESAGVNLALINYYYGSKDDLLKAAVGEIMGKSSEDMYGFADGQDPVESIIGFFISISRDMIRYRKYSSLYIPDLILNDRIVLPDVVLPSVRKFFGNSRSEQECRMAAYRMVVQAQIIFLRMDDVAAYTGINLHDLSVVDHLLRTIVEDALRRD